MDDSSNSKRRRGLGVVTPNACTECRKKRAKCDGQQPCGRCASQKNADCFYEVPVRQSKEHMRTEIENLKAYQEQSERVLAAVASGDQTSQVVDRLRQGESVKAIAENLGKSPQELLPRGNVTTYARSRDHQAIGAALEPARFTSPFGTLKSGEAQGSSGTQHGDEQSLWTPWHGMSNVTEPITATTEDAMNWVPTSGQRPESGNQLPAIGLWAEQSTDHSTPDSTVLHARDQGQEAILGQDFSGEHEGHNWTNVTSDNNLVDHLMALYFCWEYPTFASLSKEHFLIGYNTGNRDYCSELLVNAILALGCRFSSLTSARADPNDESSVGDHFFAEAKRLLSEEKDHRKLTTIQALGLMSIREASSGRSSQSIYYTGQSIRLAIEMGLHLEAEGQRPLQPVPGAQAVRAATFWGAFALDHAWSLTLGRLPQFSQLSSLDVKPAIVDTVEASSWIPYTDNGKRFHSNRALRLNNLGAPLERNCTQPSNIRSVYKTFCELSEIVHNSLYLLYTPGSNFTSHDLLELYTSFLHWYDLIPATLRLGHNFTPFVLFSHMYYHYAILLLFRPFVKLNLIGSGVSPRDVCNQAADAISALVNSYSQLYTLRRTPSFVPYFVLTSTIVHLIRYGNSGDGADKLRQGFNDLQNMRGCHGFATRARETLVFLAKSWHITLPEGCDDDFEVDLEKSCRPSSVSFNQFCANVDVADMMKGIGLATESENPLFWPFPFQGRPLLPFEGDNLKKHGFELIRE
ncbi:fungal specific transcription factor protein [Rutstroemia sp. NJR-2017a BBW]|nr:fungal specific transcription factor protein [Rutstroemia sp. NJR-2017a BBW]